MHSERKNATCTHLYVDTGNQQDIHAQHETLLHYRSNAHFFQLDALCLDCCCLCRIFCLQLLSCENSVFAAHLAFKHASFNVVQPLLLLRFILTLRHGCNVGSE